MEGGRKSKVCLIYFGMEPSENVKNEKGRVGNKPSVSQNRQTLKPRKDGVVLCLPFIAGTLSNLFNSSSCFLSFTSEITGHDTIPFCLVCFVFFT